MFKKILWIVAMVSCLAFNQNALADSMCRHEGFKDMISAMKLDEAQKAKIQPIMEQMKSTMKDLRPQLVNVDKQIKDMFRSDTIDTSSMTSLVDQKSKLIGEMMKAKFTAQSQIMAVLTTEQKSTIRAKIQAMEDKIAAKYKECHEND